MFVVLRLRVADRPRRLLRDVEPVPDRHAGLHHPAPCTTGRIRWAPRPSQAPSRPRPKRLREGEGRPSHAPPQLGRKAARVRPAGPTKAPTPAALDAVRLQRQRQAARPTTAHPDRPRAEPVQEEEEAPLMEWVETTGQVPVEEAKDAALDQLVVDEQDAEFEVLGGATGGPLRPDSRRGPGAGFRGEADPAPGPRSSGENVERPGRQAEDRIERRAGSWPPVGGPRGSRSSTGRADRGRRGVECPSRSSATGGDRRRRHGGRRQGGDRDGGRPGNGPSQWGGRGGEQPPPAPRWARGRR